MKPFDLEKAKRGGRIIFRTGAPAFFGAHLPKASLASRVVVTENSGSIISLYENGK